MSDLTPKSSEFLIPATPCSLPQFAKQQVRDPLNMYMKEPRACFPHSDSACSHKGTGENACSYREAHPAHYALRTRPPPESWHDEAERLGT